MKRVCLLFLILSINNSHAMEHRDTMIDQILHKTSCPLLVSAAAASHVSTPPNSMAFAPSLETDKTPLQQYLLQQFTHIVPTLSTPTEPAPSLASYFLAAQYQLERTYTQLNDKRLNAGQEEELWPQEELSSAISDLPDFFSALEGNLTDATIYVCRICKNRLEGYEQISEHNRNVHGRRFSCKYCGYGAATRGRRDDHVNAIHLHKRPHVCRYCFNPFPYKASLHSHERICRENPKNKFQIDQHYFCPHCSKMFTREEKLKAHIAKSH